MNSPALQHRTIYVHGRDVCAPDCPLCWSKRVIGECRITVTTKPKPTAKKRDAAYLTPSKRSRTRTSGRPRCVPVAQWSNGLTVAIDEQAVRAEYACGAGVHEIARKFHIATRRVSRILGVLLRTKGRKERQRQAA